ncbi:MAG: alpha/beta fold hydrolase, partial [Planctomycetota bacterium]
TPVTPVVLVHGMLSGRRSMQPMSDAMRQDGYPIMNWTYKTMGRSINQHAERLAEDIADRRLHQITGRLHFVGHSMGCIVIRQTVRFLDLAKGSRIVMLAPPNAGSRLTRLPLGPFAGWFPHLVELSESSDSFVNRLPEPSSTEVGVIAARRDKIVDLHSTRLNTMRDHLVVDTSHQRLPTNPNVIHQARRFLSTGSFDRASDFDTSLNSAQEQRKAA